MSTSSGQGPLALLRRFVRRRPSAAMILGLMTGSLATVTVLPSFIPVVYRSQQTERADLLHEVRATARVTALLANQGQDPKTFRAETLGTDGYWIVEDGEPTHLSGVHLDLPDLASLCAPDRFNEGYLTIDGQEWVAACAPSQKGIIVAARKGERHDFSRMSWLFIGLSLMVGISSALGVLHLLSPLARISEALKRVQEGQRGVRLKNTGMRELDDLIGQLNAAAQAIEDREDDIRARFDVVQDMARWVAHEVRNPMQSVELLTSLMSGESNASERRELAHSVHKEVAALDAVIQRMLRDSEGGVLQLIRGPQRMDVLVQQAIELQELVARKHQASVRFERALPITAFIDRTLWMRALENLLRNALQHVPAQDGQVTVQMEKTGTSLLIHVDDNGPGVDPDHGESIYDPAFSMRKGGTGVGLHLVKTVIRAHNGTVSHQQSKLGGARFTLSLPLDQESS